MGSWERILWSLGDAVKTPDGKLSINFFDKKEQKGI